MTILDGKLVSEKILDQLKKKVSKLKRKPTFAIIQVGDLEESNKYIKNKLLKASKVGIVSSHFKFEEKISESDLINKINKIKKDYDGIIVQLPLPNHINSQNVLDAIDLDKDIDGLSSKNMNNFYNDMQPHFCPATARAVLCLLQHYKINLNQKILVIGESNLVGKPTKKLLSKFTQQIESRNINTGISNSEEFDILIVAAGSPKLIKKENVKKNAIVVDVGITILDNKKLQGDVDFDDVKNKVLAISPVPGGVGPLTVVCLLMNLIDKFV